jgi:hypothetical protein
MMLARNWLKTTKEQHNIEALRCRQGETLFFEPVGLIHATNVHFVQRSWASPELGEKRIGSCKIVFRVLNELAEQGWAGEAAGGAMVYAHACSAAGTANFTISGLGNFPHNLVIDTPVKEVLFIYELYVNFISC